MEKLGATTIIPVIDTDARELFLSGFDRDQLEKAAKYFLKNDYKGCRLKLKVGRYSLATPMSQQDLGYVIEFLNVLPTFFTKLLAKCQEYGVVLKYAAFAESGAFLAEYLNKDDCQIALQEVKFNFDQGTTLMLSSRLHARGFIDPFPQTPFMPMPLNSIIERMRMPVSSYRGRGGLQMYPIVIGNQPFSTLNLNPGGLSGYQQPFSNLSPDELLKIQQELKNKSREMTGEITRRVYVSNVPDFYTEKLIKDIFSAFGGIVQVKLIPAILPEQPQPNGYERSRPPRPRGGFRGARYYMGAGLQDMEEGYAQEAVKESYQPVRDVPVQFMILYEDQLSVKKVIESMNGHTLISNTIEISTQYVRQQPILPSTFEGYPDRGRGGYRGRGRGGYADRGRGGFRGGRGGFRGGRGGMPLNFPERADYDGDLSTQGPGFIEMIDVNRKEAQLSFLPFISKAFNNLGLSVQDDQIKKIGYMVIELPKDELSGLCSDFSGAFSQRVKSLNDQEGEEDAAGERRPTRERRSSPERLERRRNFLEDYRRERESRDVRGGMREGFRGGFRGGYRGGGRPARPERRGGEIRSPEGGRDTSSSVER